MSDDLLGVKSYEFIMKRVSHETDSKENKNWQKIWIKVLNDKLLFFPTADSTKANMIYDLQECEIKAKCFEEIKNYSKIKESEGKEKDN